MRNTSKLPSIDTMTYTTGYNAGYGDGVNDSLSQYKSAISDGLRCGSSECGRAMRGLRK